MAQLVERRYASALFEIAKELNKITEFQTQAKYVVEAFNNDKDFRAIIDHPQITKVEKFNMIETIFKDKIDENMLGLFNVVFKKNRESEIVNILQTYVDMVDDYNGIVVAYVKTAIELTDEQTEKIRENLSKKLNKQVKMECSVDKSIIGGLFINVSGHTVDGTISNKIEDIRRLALS